MIIQSLSPSAPQSLSPSAPPPPCTSASEAHAAPNMLTWHGGIDDGSLAYQPALAGPVTVVRDLEQICDLITAGGLPDAALAALSAHGIFLAARNFATASSEEKPGSDLVAPLRQASRRLTSLATGKAASAVTKALTRQRVCCDLHVGQLSARELCARLLLEARRIQREATPA